MKTSTFPPLRCGRAWRASEKAGCEAYTGAGVKDGGFAVRSIGAAREDLLRLFDFLLDRAEAAEDFDHAQSVIDTLKAEVEGHLGRSPFIFRKAGKSPFLRELMVPMGATGYVALYEIQDWGTVNILAVRHQRADDYH